MTDVASSRSLLKRDSMIMGLIGTAHLSSHFFQLCLPPLFPLLHSAFNVNYVKLGSLITILFLVSGVCQAFAGIIVDRFGSRPILLLGIVTMATCVLLCAFVTKFWMFYPLMVLLGAGNSVFHPADFSALSHQISKTRLGRAYSVHAFSGTIGYAAAPTLVGGIALLTNWHIALITAGIFGWIVALLFIRYGRHYISDQHHLHYHHANAKISYRRLIVMPVILFSFCYFLFTAGVTTGVQTFAPTALIDFYNVTLAAATSVLSAYLISSAIGILLGGVIADHTTRHVFIATSGLALSAMAMLAVAANWLSFSSAIIAIAASGLCQGITSPSRDVLVKGATPPGSTGRVFGFVYSGLDAGSTLSPLLFGILIDHHQHRAIFAAIAIMLTLAIFAVLQIGNRQNVVQEVA